MHVFIVLFIGEMRSFTEDSAEEHFSLNWGLFLILLLINDIIGLTLSLTVNWEVGFGVGLGLFLFEYVVLGKDNYKNLFQLYNAIVFKVGMANKYLRS